jgi:hypothetical protein
VKKWAITKILKGFALLVKINGERDRGHHGARPPICASSAALEQRAASPAARTGSANFSRSGETRQDNDLVALRGASVCAGFDAKFGRAWARS